MTSTVQIVLSCFVGAIASLATNETSVVLACDGCSPDGSVRHYHWQNNGAQPPVWDWYTGGGQIQYNSPVPNHDTGKCKIANGQCVPDPEDTCRAEIQLEITSSTLIRFVSDASGCVKWSDLPRTRRISWQGPPSVRTRSSRTCSLATTTRVARQLLAPLGPRNS